MLTSGNNRAGICEEWCGEIGQGNGEAKNDKDECGERSIVRSSPYFLVGCFAAVLQLCCSCVQSSHDIFPS